MGMQQVFPQEANSNARMTLKSLQDQSTKMSLPTMNLGIGGNIRLATKKEQITDQSDKKNAIPGTS